MNEYLIYGSIIGSMVGLLLGYITGKIQDSYHIEIIKKTYENLIEIKEDDFNRTKEFYRTEINRLNSLLATEAVKNSKSPKATKMSDLVEIALSKDGFEELDFPNGGEK